MAAPNVDELTESLAGLAIAPEDTAPRVLIAFLFDLNGTLVHRGPVRGGRPAIAASEHRDTAGKAVYVRPGVPELLSRLRADPRVLVGMYSSTMARNTVPLSVAALGLAGSAGHLVLARALRADDPDAARLAADCPEPSTCAPLGRVLIFDRRFNRPDPTLGKHETVRDLAAVLEAAPVRDAKLDARRVVLVDNEFRKVAAVAANAIVVNTFEGPEVAATGDEAAALADETRVLSDYCDMLIGAAKADAATRTRVDGDQGDFDVREVMRACPFVPQTRLPRDEDAKPRAKGAPSNPRA